MKSSLTQADLKSIVNYSGKKWKKMVFSGIRGKTCFEVSAQSILMIKDALPFQLVIVRNCMIAVIVRWL